MSPEQISILRDTQKTCDAQRSILIRLIQGAFRRISSLSFAGVTGIEIFSDERIKITYDPGYTDADYKHFCMPFSAFESEGAFVFEYNKKVTAYNERNKRLEERKKNAEEARTMAEEMGQEAIERAELKRLTEKYGTTP